MKCVMVWWCKLNHKARLDTTIAVIGLGYVGAPLAFALAKHFRVIGFDTNPKRIQDLQHGFDEHTQEHFVPPKSLHYSNTQQDLIQATMFIIAVPTPIFADKTPDLRYLDEASKIVGGALKKGDMVVYESTTYPFCTREYCGKVLQKTSSLVLDRDFFIGYSPERINPGDNAHTLQSITKIIAASTPQARQRMERVYGSVVDSLYVAPSIEVAEMAKLIENAQRDLNIAFVNEVAMMCDRLGLSANAVLEAAKSKWNFLPFMPGLVGGHCISVDPYYLSYILQMCDYKPKVLSMGRLVNEQMPTFLAKKLSSIAKECGLVVSKSKVLLLGLAFKENCRDMRNSKTPILRKKLKKYGFKVKVYDPLIDRAQAKQMFGFKPLKSLGHKKFDIIVLLNAHSVFMDIDLREYVHTKHSIFDMKGILPYATHRL